MVLVYLWLNGLLFALFAVWCTLRPEQTSAFLGLEAKGWKGLSEYVAVYGGLQAGLAVFYMLAALKPALQKPALWLSVCMYLGLVAFRSIVLVRSDFAIGTATGAFILELVLGILALILLLRMP
jgi:hypothetical protein